MPPGPDSQAEVQFATARSSLPSRFRSPTATCHGVSPTAKSVCAPNVPSPFPSSTDTVFEPMFVTARSGLPSRFRSATATAQGVAPAG